MTEQDLVKILWVGGSFYYRKNSMTEIIKTIGDCDTYICENQDKPIEYYENILLSNDILDPKKMLFIFRDIPQGKTSTVTNKQFINFLSKVQTGSYVVVEGIEEREKQVIFKYIKENGKIISFPSHLERDKAIEWVANRISQTSKQMEQEIIEYMVDSIGIEKDKGINTDRLYMSLKKLVNYIGKEKKITKDIALKVCDRYSNVIVYQFYDAIDKKDVNTCFKMLYQLCHKEGIKNGVNSLLYVLLWRFRLLLILKDLQFNKQNNISNYLSENLFKLKREGLRDEMSFSIEKDDDGKDKPYYTQYVTNNNLKGFYGKTPDVDKYSREEIYAALRCIEEALLYIRVNSDEHDCLLMADNFIYTICNLLDHKILTKIREIKN